MAYAETASCAVLLLNITKLMVMRKKRSVDILSVLTFKALDRSHIVPSATFLFFYYNLEVGWVLTKGSRQSVNGIIMTSMWCLGAFHCVTEGSSFFSKEIRSKSNLQLTVTSKFVSNIDPQGNFKDCHQSSNAS